MIAGENPFFFRELPLTAPFCNRKKELSDLFSYARAHANVLIYSPRRYGKTSLIKRVQKNLFDDGTITAFADFFGVSSTDDVATRLAKSIFEITRKKESIFKSAIKFLKTFRPVLKPDESGTIALTVEPSSPNIKGAELLDETMSSIEKFSSMSSSPLNIALDEFQEITNLGDSLKIEGIMRSHIQKENSSFFFIGSRRHLLLAIFNEQRRPFFQSAINYKLDKLPHDELANFIRRQFETNGRKCDAQTASFISNLVDNHPYYSQKLAFFVYEASEKKINEEVATNSFNVLMESEQPVFEAVIQGLAPQQISLFKAIAKEPSKSVFSASYMKKHDLGSTGGIQGALGKLVLLDLIEQARDKTWSVVDPVFARWMRG